MAKRGERAPRSEVPPLSGSARAAIHADPRPDTESAAVREHLVIFQVADGSFGLRLGAVGEIIRVPGLARMPLAPPSLLGLANLRGAVLPVVSLRRLLNLPDAPANEATRVIVLDGEAPVGFVVDQVDRLRLLRAEQIENPDAGTCTVDPELLEGAVKGAEGDAATKILNPQRLLRDQFVRLGNPGPPAHVAATVEAATPTRSATPSQRQKLFISFEAGRQEYALPLEDVREIIPLPDHVAEMPRSETAVLGVITLRDRLLPLVSLRALLGLEAKDQREERGKVVVVPMGSGAVGIVVDRTREILRIDPHVIDPAPALLTRGAGDAEITSICRLEGGRRLVALLSRDRLFRSDLVRRVLAEQGNEDAAISEARAHEDVMTDEQFVIFRLGDQEFGLPVGAVDEIARPPRQVTPVPKAPAFIDGVMNLRGRVVPIVDLRRRFGLVAREPGSSQRVLVLAIDGGKTGFLVDGVSEVMKVPTGAITLAPQLSTEQMRLIGRVVNLEAQGRMILLVDAAQLLDRVEADLLAKFDRSRLAQVSTAS
jgi:purine-binding chemotaxis protein CheW